MLGFLFGVGLGLGLYFLLEFEGIHISPFVIITIMLIMGFLMWFGSKGTRTGYAFETHHYDFLDFELKSGFNAIKNETRLKYVVIILFLLALPFLIVAVIVYFLR